MTRMMTAAVLAATLFPAGSAPAAGQVPWNVFAVPTADRAELVWQMTENVAECIALRREARLGVWLNEPGSEYAIELSTKVGRAHVVIYNSLGAAVKAFRRFTPAGAVKDACEWFAGIDENHRERE